jgi:hypothetical protein
VLEEVVVPGWQRRDPQVGDAVREVVVAVCGLAALELGVQRQGSKPCVRRVAELADRRARVGEEKPPALVVVAEHLGDPVGPACEQLGRESRLECLHRSACLEPGDAIGERHAQHCRPRSFVPRLDDADRFDVQANPVFGGAVHAPTMPPRCVRSLKRQIASGGASIAADSTGSRNSRFGPLNLAVRKPRPLTTRCPIRRP